jgi:hypothetical protein
MYIAVNGLKITNFLLEKAIEITNDFILIKNSLNIAFSNLVISEVNYYSGHFFYIEAS